MSCMLMANLMWVIYLLIKCVINKNKHVLCQIISLFEFVDDL